ncbi:hypothetical protein LPMP_354830 [Leishmania panamensis]|uniref:Uncharacterized protein n=1 Tax=Leishmania panamensis TaxID=5679 RepID=A0A088S2Z5_LEIPA|nr:hypothetical protein LPMP_354830 [Leishmania panamensis]AIO02614.1 hypothetical protein LPMP_354830 [Leishmania panamensis]
MELDNLQDEVLMGDTNEVTVPAAVVASATVLDIGFHPRLPIMAAGLITGEVEIYKRKSVSEMIKIPLQNDFSSWIFTGQYNEDEVVMNYHHQNMRMHPSGGISSMEFTDDGTYLVSASSDRTISVMDCVSLRLVIHIPADEMRAYVAGKKKLNAMNMKNDPTAKGEKGARRRAAATGRSSGSGGCTVPVNPHKHGISSINVCDENLIATGDDDGLIVVWDMRVRNPVYNYHEHGDYVSQLCYFTDAQELVSSSGDTCLGVYDMRAGKIRDFSVRRKDELNCFAFINSSGISNATFIPSIVCGTPHGGLPIWKYGSWARPYDVMDHHPAECEAIISFHGESTAFNHNLILTGACDGLIRVLQMYPVRRNLCQLSGRDYTYSHSNVLGNHSSSCGQQQQGNYVVRRARGQEAISRMCVSHDAHLLAVSGSDNIIDFVDIAFMNDEAALDQLRGRAEQRHLRTLRDLDREQDEEAEHERRLIEGCGAGTKSEESSDNKVGSGASSSSSEGSNVHVATDAGKQARLDQREALEQKLTKLGLVRKKRSHSDSSSSSSTDDSDEGGASGAKKNRASTKAWPLSGKRGDATAREGAAAPIRSPYQAIATAPQKVSRQASRGISDTGTTANGVPLKTKKKPLPAKMSASAATVTSTDASNANPGTVAASCFEARESRDSMEVYRTERQKKRERAAAARWLKEERRKKVNFTYEKRRRRVGGFFGDMVNRENDSD